MTEQMQDDECPNCHGYGECFQDVPGKWGTCLECKGTGKKKNGAKPHDSAWSIQQDKNDFTVLNTQKCD